LNKGDLEFAVDFGKANGGGILEGSIGFSEALKRSHTIMGGHAESPEKGTIERERWEKWGRRNKEEGEDDGV